MITDWVRGISYKPGWTFQHLHHSTEGDVLRITTDVADSTHPDTAVTLRIDTFIPPCANHDSFMTWLHYRLCRIETHEVSEWLRYRGARWREPHAPLDQQLVTR